MKHVCKFAGCSVKEGMSQRSFIYHIKKYHNIGLKDYYLTFVDCNIPKCKFCGDDVSWDQTHFKFREVCSNKRCICKLAKQYSNISIKNKYGVDNISQIPSWDEKVKKTKKERYGDPNYNNMDKNKSTCIERYGVDNGSKTEVARQKISKKYEESNKKLRIQKTINTNLEKRGKEWNFQFDEVKEKKKETYIKNWGVEHPMKSDEYKKIFTNGLMQKFGVNCISKLQYIKDKISDTNFKKRKERLKSKFGDIIIDFPTKYSVKILCPKCSKISESNICFFEQRAKFKVDLCLHCTPYKVGSYLQTRLTEWVENLGFVIERDAKIPNNRKEMDIYIPSKNLAFEFNGLYWHSDKFSDMYDIYNKKMLGNKEGINIIHIWEDDFILRQELVENKIKKELGLYDKVIDVNECSVVDISGDFAEGFLYDNDLLSYSKAQINLGLLIDDELVSIMTFGKKRAFGEMDWQIFRFADKCNYKIDGSFKRLLDAFESVMKPKRISAFCDLDWSNYRSNEFENNGFIFKRVVKPDYYYLIGGKREKQTFRKSNLVKRGFDEELSEKQIMKNLGHKIIWNCGSLKYEKHFE